MENPIPPNYMFVRSLENGFLGKTCVVEEISTKNLKICKFAMKSKFGSQDAVQRFIERQDHIKSINSPFVVPYTDIYEKEDHLILIRDYLDSPPLNSDKFSDDIDYNSKLAMWKIIVRSFAHLHSHHIYPIYIRPSNLFYIDNKFLMITDIFTLPPNYDVMTHSPNIFEIGFLAPEYFTRSSQPCHKADIWSLGVILYFMFTKRLPWETKNVFTVIQQILNGSIDLINNDLPNGVLEYLGNMIIVNPNERVELENLAEDRLGRRKIQKSLDSAPQVGIPLVHTHGNSFLKGDSLPLFRLSDDPKATSNAARMLLNSKMRNVPLGNNAQNRRHISNDFPLYVRKRTFQ